MNKYIFFAFIMFATSLYAQSGLTVRLPGPKNNSQSNKLAVEQGPSNQAIADVLQQLIKGKNISPEELEQQENQAEQEKIKKKKKPLWLIKQSKVWEQERQIREEKKKAREKLSFYELQKLEREKLRKANTNTKNQLKTKDKAFKSLDDF